MFRKSLDGTRMRNRRQHLKSAFIRKGIIIALAFGIGIGGIVLFANTRLWLDDNTDELKRRFRQQITAEFQALPPADRKALLRQASREEWRSWRDAFTDITPTERAVLEDTYQTLTPQEQARIKQYLEPASAAERK